jgi:hypothetical protein
VVYPGSPAGSPNKLTAQIETFRGVISSGTPYDTNSTNTSATSGATTHEGSALTAAYVNLLNVTSFGVYAAGGFSGWTNAAFTVTERIDQAELGVATGPMTATGAYALVSATTANTTWSAAVTLTLRP